MDALANGRKFRTANLKDDCTRECPAIEVALSIPGTRVVEMLERVARERGYPDMLTVDNGPELRGRALDQWAHGKGVQLYFIDCILSIRANQLRMPILKVSTGAFVKNA